MATPREKFQKLLRKLFQFDCAELDFGIYRIMNHKRGVIERFIDKDLLDGVARELASGALARESGLSKELAEVAEQIRELFGDEALDPEGSLAETFHGTPLGKRYLELRARAVQARSSPELEVEIFNHLYAFFSRYYDEGDFMSLRRYSKRDRYAIPYNGEEVHLHWANSDQYYIKTGENFTDYRYQHGGWAVQFALRQADVEQNNNKGAKRFFLPRVKEIKLDRAAKTFTIPFEYRPLSKGEETHFGKANGNNDNGEGKGKAKAKKGQEGILAEAVPAINAAARDDNDVLIALTHEKRKNADGEPVTLLEHHLRTYTKKNQTDYFIHKDLQGFLERELDFYLKNEVLNLDDLEAGGEFRAGSWFQLLRAIKAVGRKIIAFVAQIENFQKKLFEKKKFVTEVHYCVSLDRVPPELYSEILLNKTQIDEWKRVFHIHEMNGDLVGPGYKEPLSKAFLTANGNLPIDTCLFAAGFKDRLVQSNDAIDALSEGLLIHSENLQALELLKKRYTNEVTAIYADPPYNSDASPINYKNGYRHSSWISLLENRLHVAKSLLVDSGIACLTIDDYEAHYLRCLCERVMPEMEALGVVAIKNNPAGRTGTVGFSICHEYALFYGQAEAARVNRLEHSEAQKARYKERDESGFFEWTNFRKHGGLNTYRTARPHQFYPIYVKAGKVRIPNMTWDDMARQWISVEAPKANEEVLLPVDEKGRERIWDFVPETAKKNLDDFLVKKDAKGATAIYRKWYINEEGLLPQTWWDKSEYSAAEYGTNLLTKLFGVAHAFMFPKSVYAVADCLKVCGLRSDVGGLALDFFAGSGTTGHAVINLNREDGGNRQYLLIESGEYFDEVLVGRLKRVIYSKDWKDGKPVSCQGSSHCFKYIRLESYEDALDNITFTPTDDQAALQFEDSDYLLRYMLDFETKSSDTLLNVAKLDAPFDYKLRRHGRDELLPVDLAETFNYLIGLHVRTRRAYMNGEVRYLVYRGLAEGRETAVVWRTTRGWEQKEFEADRDFVANKKLVEGAEAAYVNTDSFIAGARSLDPVFKRLMFSEE